MKNKLMLFFWISILAAGCNFAPKHEPPIAKVNNYEITKEEFEEEFRESAFGRRDTFESRKEFLDNLINQKLILQDAQAKGLDKDKGFLKAIEKFWEQSLLKIALDKKAEEIAGQKVSRDEQQKLMNDWIDGLRKGAIIKTDENMLKADK